MNATSGLWGRPCIDLFATAQTKRLDTYCSPVPDPGAIYIDAFLVDWSNLDVYAFPYFKIIHRVLKKFVSHERTGMTLVAPY